MKIVVTLLALLLCGVACAGEVTVAVAANFAATMQEIASSFERATGHRAVLVFGSTGKFHAQLRNGAPFDVLLAADESTPARLVEEKLAVAGTPFTYAVGRLVLWSATPGKVDAGGDVLRKAGEGPLAIADPRVAPYGAAAMQVLERLGVLASWRGHIVQGESIAQGYQFVATGNAPLGFVALSQVMKQGRIASGSAWVVPDSLHAPLRQDAVLLVRARGNAAAAALMQYLRGDAARSVMQAHGYAALP